MDPFKEYKPILEEYLHKEVIPHLEAAWHEPWRFYHGMNHLITILETLKEQRTKIHPLEYDTLVLAAFFHDCYYNTRDHKVNEHESINRFTSSFKSSKKPLYWKVSSAVVEMILATKFRKVPNSKLIKIFWEADNAGFYKGYEALLEYENLIRKEYVHVSKKQYKKGRVDFLKTNLGLFNESVDRDVNRLIEYVNVNY